MRNCEEWQRDEDMMQKLMDGWLQSASMRHVYEPANKMTRRAFQRSIKLKMA